MPYVDALKAVASQFIVLHHLAAYGPMSDVVYEHAAGLFDWLYHDARMAVQVFFVVGGFLAARTLAPGGVAAFSSPLALLWRRYCRLAIPYVTAILISVGAAAVARAWMEHESVPGTPTLSQFLSHVFLLHDVLGYEALSAGVWYVAIDFQLFGLMVALLWVARPSGAAGASHRWASPLLLWLTAIASLLYFNRNADWDVWALYFVAAYVLGALAYWASERTHSALWLGALAAVALLSVVVDFRPRILVALAVAITIGVARRTGVPARWPTVPLLSFLGRIAYSVFLVHFPVCMLINAAVFRFFGADPVANLVGLFIAWGASIGAGWLLYHLVESRTERLLTKGSLASSPHDKSLEYALETPVETPR
jgi:peptidoglycan/LPS O-acetylase OafA/YrhL